MTPIILDTPAPAWAPTPADVAALTGAYTREHVGGYDGGREQGSFTSNTSPTLVQVQAFIVEAVREVTARVGREIPGIRYDLARTTALWKVVADVEATRRPAQTDDAVSEYASAISNYRANLDRLTQLVATPDLWTG